MPFKLVGSARRELFFSFPISWKAGARERTHWSALASFIMETDGLGRVASGAEGQDT